MTTPSEESKNIVISNALGSAAAGIIARIATHPLDTAKARLQSLSGSNYRGSADVLVKTFRSEGIVGLYRGFTTVIVGGTPGTIIYLCSYDIFKDRISSALFPNNATKSSKNEESFAVHFGAGLSAEALACLIYVPVDVIKERLQIQNRTDLVQYKGGLDALVKICKTEGPMGIYKGYGATLASFGPFSALYFVFYEKFKLWSKGYLERSQDDATSKENEPTSGQLPLSFTILSSASAGSLASFLTSPLDMVKLRLQVQRRTESLPSYKESNIGINPNPTYRGMLDGLAHSYRSGGIPGLFRGAGARVLHFVPLTTILMTSYETCRSFVHQTLIQ